MDTMMFCTNEHNQKNGRVKGMLLPKTKILLKGGLHGGGKLHEQISE